MINPRIGQRLRAARQRAGLSQAQLARLAEVTDAQLSNYETGTREPTIRTLEKLAAALGVPSGSFLERQ